MLLELRVVRSLMEVVVYVVQRVFFSFVVLTKI